MLYSLSNGFLFIHVSRTGGSTLKKMLRAQVREIQYGLDQHGTALAAQSQLSNGFEDLFRFAFVRNPWDRLVSWYYLIGRLNYHDHTEDRILDPDFLHWKGFDQFLDSWCNLQTHDHGIPQKKFSQ